MVALKLRFADWLERSNQLWPLWLNAPGFNSTAYCFDSRRAVYCQGAHRKACTFSLYT